MFVWAHYIDDTDIPGYLSIGVLSHGRLESRTYRNRFDGVEGDLPIQLAAATTAQVGALGEETAMVLLEELFDATIVSAGDAAMPRNEGRQDLDLLAIIDGELIAYEVKTRYHSAKAGRLTRAGNLSRPRMRRPSRPDGRRQGSQRYVAERLTDFIDTESEYKGIEVRVLAIDFEAMLAQEFTLDDAGRRLAPRSRVCDCSAAAEEALARIVNHRGYL